MKQNRVYFKDDFLEMQQVDNNNEGLTTFNMKIDWSKETVSSKEIINKLVNSIYDYVDMRNEKK
jgi:hypothetical protein